MNLPVGAEHAYLVKREKRQAHFGGIKPYFHSFPEANEYKGKKAAKPEYVEQLIYPKNGYCG